MERYDTVVIGGGYGGLTCAFALAKEGQNVCVLEKEHVVGGAFQSFNRGTVKLDTGFHYVGGIREGEIMWPIVDYLDLNNLPWVQMDDDFLEIHTHGGQYQLWCGYENFAQSLKEQFPDEAEGIDAIVELMLNIRANMYKTVAPVSEYDNYMMRLSAMEWLNTHFHNPILINLLCGQAVTTDICPTLPLYSFLQSLNSFIQHSYRLRGGGQVLIEHLCKGIESIGGVIKTHSQVTQLTSDGNGRILSAICSNGNEYQAQTFISTIHPALSVELMPECPQVRGIYRRRFARMENTNGMFTVQLQLRKQAIPYLNRSISIIGSSNIWNANYGIGAPVENMLINYNPPMDGEWALNIDLLTPMNFENVAQWSESHVGQRPDDYKDFKRHKAEECIALAIKHHPVLDGNIERYWTSTPLTYRDYTGIPEGAAYGLRKNFSAMNGGMLSPATPFPNMFFAGQSLMLHGMLGVSMTSLLVCNIITNKFIGYNQYHHDD